ncbi:MAG: hypothetical protein KBA31_14350 [Alphaproteobacteria bacterium]|nr:hypothetical protein [Alphaproteobacteria bacterium]
MRLAATSVFMIGLFSADALGEPVKFQHLVVRDQTVHVQNPSQLTVEVGRGFRVTEPHNFTKQEDNGYHFEVSLVSFVAPHEVVSVAAERLVEDKALNYDELSAASWPDAGFLSRAKGCATLTVEQAAKMPEASGMRWIVEAGFIPNGAFAFEAALLVAPDRRHEASIELIAPVGACTDAHAIDAALDALRARIVTKRKK